MLEMCLAISPLAPVPTASIAITAVTPIIIPSMVRADRILFTRNARNDILNVDCTLIIILLPGVTNNETIQKFYCPPAIRCYIRLMGNKYYGNI